MGVMGRDGLPKKGGAGGKGTWGLPGDELLIDGPIQKDDPNYDVKWSGLCLSI